MNARKTTVQNQRVTVSFQRAPATTDVVVHKARKLGASRGARGALWAHASSVHNRVNALRSSARDGRTKTHCAESTSYNELQGISGKLAGSWPGQADTHARSLNSSRSASTSSAPILIHAPRARE